MTGSKRPVQNPLRIAVRARPRHALLEQLEAAPALGTTSQYLVAVHRSWAESTRRMLGRRPDCRCSRDPVSALNHGNIEHFGT